MTSVALRFRCAAVIKPVMSETKRSGYENGERCGMQSLECRRLTRGCDFAAGSGSPLKEKLSSLLRLEKA